jgi:hypothetical protein
MNEVNDEFEFKDRLLYFKGFLYIPSGPIQVKIIQMRHDLFSGWTFWLQQNYGIDMKRFLVATNVETCKGIYSIM